MQWVRLFYHRPGAEAIDNDTCQCQYANQANDPKPGENIAQVMAMRANAAAASPAMPIDPCGRNRASNEKTTRGKKARMRELDFTPETSGFLPGQGAGSAGNATGPLQDKCAYDAGQDEY